MKRTTMAAFGLGIGLALGGISLGADSAAPAGGAATQPAAVDLHNTNCAVSGEAVGDSKLTETYNGKIYHFCCADCPKMFLADPAKYAKAVSDNPAKYGVK